MALWRRIGVGHGDGMVMSMGLRCRLVATVLTVGLLAPACGDSDGGSIAGSRTATTKTATSTIETTSSTTEPGTRATEPLSIGVEDLFDGDGPRQVLIEGFVFVEPAGSRLCATLLESYPPQCGWAWIVIANPEGLDVELDETQGIAWTPGPVHIDGFFDGSRLLVAAGPDVAPTAADDALVAAFTDFATTGNSFENIPFTDQVALGLADRIVRTVPVAELADRAAWVIEDDEFRARTGPFTALELAIDEATITIGSHAHCASPPVAAPAGFADHRRVSIQPANATSCLEWSTVDLFIDADGKVAAITLDLFEP